MNLKYTNRAKNDLELAFVWYEKQRRGLGFDLLDCIETAVKSIMDTPKAYQVYYSCFRGYIIRRFPFTVFYSVEENTIIVHSVFDNRQDPDKKP